LRSRRQVKAGLKNLHKPPCSVRTPLSSADASGASVLRVRNDGDRQYQAGLFESAAPISGPRSEGRAKLVPLRDSIVTSNLKVATIEGRPSGPCWREAPAASSEREWGLNRFRIGPRTQETRDNGYPVQENRLRLTQNHGRIFATCRVGQNQCHKTSATKLGTIIWHPHHSHAWKQ
jgi:hypothetical protein